MKRYIWERIGPMSRIRLDGSRRQKDKRDKMIHSPARLTELGRWLHERKAEEIELWAAIEKPHGRIVDFLLDHGVVPCRTSQCAGPCCGTSSQ